MEQLEKEYDVNLSDTDQSDEEDLYELLMDELVEKFNKPDTSYSMKLQILTLTKSSLARTAKRFKTTEHMVRVARKIKENTGILSTPGIKTGSKTISEDSKQAVINFFERDDISRIMPGKKDCISVRDDQGVKQAVQKRLILANLREVYSTYKSEAQNPVGFSTFAQLRPPWCVLAGSAGTHSICVCVKHQNPKLMLTVLDPKVTIDEIMAKTVCDMENEACMMRKCSDCRPNLEQLTDFVDEKLGDVEEIEYQQWINTDRSNLIVIKEGKDEFAKKFVSSIEALTGHHFVAKAQNQYLKQLKEHMGTDECIVLGDFAENYAFIIQDAVSGFHWNNDQATIHPFVVYYRNNDGQLTNKNFCVISDHLGHSTSSFYAFQEKILAIIKSENNIRTVHYFTDGAPTQYKNKNNFRNICLHLTDFDMACKWNFFATGHGKGPCDGIGGTVKRLAARASLQRIAGSGGQILSAQDLHRFCSASVPGMASTYSLVIHLRAYLKALFKVNTMYVQQHDSYVCT